MVTLKLFGLLRLDTGLKELELEASTVGELYPLLLDAARRANPATTVSARDIAGCIVVINGVQAGRRSRLAPGDVVMLLSPVCGG